MMVSILELALSALFLLVIGAYGYAYRIDQRLTRAILDLRDNHLHALDERVRRLERRVVGEH
jgi:hypothetical protein